jgi:dihydroneopterin aldolase
MGELHGTMATISLEGLVFHAKHGVFAEERVLGGRYEVSLFITADIRPAALSNDLADTVDYGAVYAVVAEVMQRPRRLIETLCDEIGTSVVERFERVLAVRVRVEKHAPPVGGLSTLASVEELYSR